MGKRKKLHRKSGLSSRKLRCETLEDRRMLATFMVTNTNDLGAGSLRDAITVANVTPGSDEIVFADGVEGTISLNSELMITDSLDLIGTDFPNRVTLDANGQSRVINIEGPNIDVSLNRFIVQNGLTTGSNANPQDTSDNGAGIRFASTGVLTLTSITFFDNQTTGTRAEGGAVYSAGDLNILNTGFFRNSTGGNFAHGGAIAADGDVAIHGGRIDGSQVNGASAMGGAIYVSAEGSLELSSVIVSSNSTTGLNGEGGAIAVSGPATINKSRISGNSTNTPFSEGGGIYSESSLTLIESVVSENNTFGDSSRGAGIYSAVGDVTLLRTTVSNNATAGADSPGGGILMNGASSTLTVEGSTISGNLTTGVRGGGAAVFSYGDVTLDNSTISGNRAQGDGSRGGGVTNDGALTIRNSTITENFAADEITNPREGGGGVRKLSATGTVSIVDSIIAGNETTSNLANDILIGDTTPHDINFTLIGSNNIGPINSASGQGNLIGTTVNPVDPGLGPLANNGGRTKTHALLADSVAIDIGTPTFLGGADQRGNPFDRTFDGNGDGNARIDLGAYERQTLLNNQWIVQTTADGILSSVITLRRAIGFANGNIGPDTITFVERLRGAVTLREGELDITDSVTIIGPGEDVLAIDGFLGGDGIVGGSRHRVFTIDDGDDATVSSVAISGLSIRNGDNDRSGGGILSHESLTLDSATVVGNRTIGSNSRGGGIHFIGLPGTSLTITDSTIANNRTENFGGGLSTSLGDNNGATVSVDRTTIRDNFAQDNGGGIFNRNGIGSSFTITSSTISGNETQGEGGGLHTRHNVAGDTTASLTNVTISGNTAWGRGGGIFAETGAVNIDHSTITQNTSDQNDNGLGFGGGIYELAGATVDLDHTIVADNTDMTGTAPDFGEDGNMSQVRFSLIGNTTGSDVTPATGIGNILGFSPLLDSLQDNGGPTLTHALLPGSLAIDIGDPTLTNLPNYDQRGFGYDRVVDGRIDIGAVESGATSADFDADEDVDGFDFLAWQRGFGAANVEHSDGDANSDGDVDADDLTIWQNNYGTSATDALGNVLTAEKDGADDVNDQTALVPTFTWQSPFSGPTPEFTVSFYIGETISSESDDSDITPVDATSAPQRQAPTSPQQPTAITASDARADAVDAVFEEFGREELIVIL